MVKWKISEPLTAEIVMAVIPSIKMDINIATMERSGPDFLMFSLLGSILGRIRSRSVVNMLTTGKIRSVSAEPYSVISPAAFQWTGISSPPFLTTKQTAIAAVINEMTSDVIKAFFIVRIIAYGGFGGTLDG